MPLIDLTNFPYFFDQVPRITLRDPLTALLGSGTGGLLSYGYTDAVRLTGHSCPTVASAYWLGVVVNGMGLRTARDDAVFEIRVA